MTPPQPSAGLFGTLLERFGALGGAELDVPPRLADGRRRDLLRQTAEEVFSAFESRVLSFAAAAARRHGSIVDLRERAG